MGNFGDVTGAEATRARLQADLGHIQRRLAVVTNERPAQTSADQRCVRDIPTYKKPAGEGCVQAGGQQWGTSRANPAFPDPQLAHSSLVFFQHRAQTISRTGSVFQGVLTTMAKTRNPVFFGTEKSYEAAHRSMNVGH